MSMYNVSGKAILKFLHDHYEFVRTVFSVSKPDFVLDAEKLQSLIATHNARGAVSDITLSRIVSLKFCRLLPTGEYKIDANYTSFLEFLFEDFVLDLPATIRSRYQSITLHFRSLQTESDEDKIVLLIQEIIKEVESFLNHIAGQTFRLLKDTEALKMDTRKHSDLTVRINKASYWIDEYIKPLNNILDRMHPDSLVSAIDGVQKLAGQKRILTDSYKLHSAYERLYTCAYSARAELDATLGKLTRELLPLLERIKGDSQILAGFYHFVENIDQPENYIIPLPGLVRKTRPTILNKSFGSEAAFYTEQFGIGIAEEIYDEAAAEVENVPRLQHFKSRLQKQGKVENFYTWCFTELLRITAQPKLSTYFTVAGLILEPEFAAEYETDDQVDIELADALLTLPNVRVYEKLSAGA